MPGQERQIEGQGRQALPAATAAAAAGRPVAIWAGFLAMCLGMFMAILDIQIVASSLPEIQAAFAIPLDRLSWVQTAYLVAEVVAIPLTARLTRLLSLRGLFAGAVAGFTLASVGCALSTDFAALIAFRTAQGFCGGAVIPAVFTAGFLLYPEGKRILPTTVAGIFAMLAPTLGPVVGGYITETYSWHWLFLINVAPGVLVVPLVAWLIRLGAADWRLLPYLDHAGVVLMALALGCLEILLREGPRHDWTGPIVLVPLFFFLAAGAGTIRRCLRSSDPLVDLRLLGDRSFGLACLYSFILGMGLYGSVYLLPLFLGLVREHSPLEIGAIMIVCGGAQLIAAPLAAGAERRFDPRMLTAIGYGLFAAGLIADGFTTFESDFAGLFLPQVLRGAGLMFCLLPTTTLALGPYAGAQLASASALFNLMRNLGGAIGISIVDTILVWRPARHVSDLVARLQAGDAATAIFVGLPADKFHGQPMGPVDEATKETIRPLVERAALVMSFNEAWLLFGAIFALAVLGAWLFPPAGRR